MNEYSYIWRILFSINDFLNLCLNYKSHDSNEDIICIYLLMFGIYYTFYIKFVLWLVLEEFKKM